VIDRYEILQLKAAMLQKIVIAVYQKKKNYALEGKVSILKGDVT
jgi:hypothetical protein